MRHKHATKNRTSDTALGGILLKKLILKFFQYSQENIREYSEICKNTYFEQHLRTPASET